MLGLLQKLLQVIGLVSVPLPKPGPDVSPVKPPKRPLKVVPKDK